MKHRFNLLFAVSCGLLASSSAIADSSGYSGDWVNLVRGYQNDEVATPLRPVDARYDAEKQRVYVSSPVGLADPNTMEEVMVTAPAPEKRGPLIQLDYEYEWADDYENDRYGLLVFFTEDSNWPLRLFMDSSTGFVR